jgi:hypothetical protein
VACTAGDLRSLLADAYEVDKQGKSNPTKHARLISGSPILSTKEQVPKQQQKSPWNLYVSGSLLTSSSSLLMHLLSSTKA